MLELDLPTELLRGVPLKLQNNPRVVTTCGNLVCLRVKDDVNITQPAFKPRPGHVAKPD